MADTSDNNILEVGAIGGAGFYGYSKIKNTEAFNTAREYYSKLIGTGYLNKQLERSINTTTGQVLSTVDQSLAKSALSQLMAVEEASPLHILRTLQLSNLIQPFTELSKNNQAIHITASQIRDQQHFYQSLINYANSEEKIKTKRSLELRDLNKGLFFKNNKLYGATKEGLIDEQDVVLKNARLVLGNVKNGDIYSKNQVLKKFTDILGTNLNQESLKINPLIVVGGKSSADFGNKWAQSMLRFSMDIGFKTLDNPLAGFEEMLHGVGAGHTGIFDTKTWQNFKKYTNIQLGTGGIYNLGIRESVARSAKNIAKKSAGLYLGYQVSDSILRTLSPNDGLFSQGLATGLANMYAGARIGFAEIWSDRFQGYKEKQEQAAPGSTDLTKLLAFPLAGALLGAQSAYFSRVGVSIVGGSEKAASIFNVEKQSNLLQKIGINDFMKPMKRNALVGGIIGAATTLPFLPGALIGTSSEELRAKYSGEKDEAVRANAGWMMGGTSWEGSNIKFFSKNWVARLRADATDKVRYGDDATKKSMDPFLHPFSYLKDPYKFEKRNAESMPYPIWGMDVSYGGLFGKIFERTIGQVIKPDVINPAIKDVTYATTEQSSGVGITSGSILNAIEYKRDVGKALTKGVESGFSSLFLEENEKLNVNSKDASLIKEGLMKAPPTGRYDPNSEAAGLTYSSFTDFTGIKGWGSSLALDALGIDPTNVPLQLARSGEAQSAARDLIDQNLGDLLGIGEFQRRLLPTSAGALPDRANPLVNNQASWLPSDETTYFNDFRRGNPYSKVTRGEERLPGVGLAALNPELKGLDPEDYPLVYKYKVLSDVARGSKEYIQTRKQVLAAYANNALSTREKEILGTTLDQEDQRQQRKDFYEKPTGFRGPVGSLQSALWETMRSNVESPLEMLTPIRPAAKFLHQRTAIEDYVATQLGGSDAGIWTNPFSHFIKPTLNKLRQGIPLGNDFFVPQETREEYNINEYFDKFDYLRKRKSGSYEQQLSTVIGSSMSGLNTKEKVLKFRAALSDNQKDYFNSFSKETDEKKREAIRAILPEDVKRGYEQIWQNVDTANKARDSGVSVQKAIAEQLHNQTKKLRAAFNVELTDSEKDKIENSIKNNSDTYADLGFSVSDRKKYASDELLRLKMADKEALTYVAERTGVPSSKFIGWDPRLKTDDIKIRTLSLGKEDLRKFGFWEQDEKRMERLSPITEQSNAVFSQIDEIKENIKSNRRLKQAIEKTMFDNGFKASKIDLVDSNYGSILVQENE